MTSFTVSTTSSATVATDRQHVWDALTDPELLPRLTPYLRRIDAQSDDRGDRWTWHLVRIPVLGSMVSPSFTEVMTFDEPSRIDFVHDPERTDEKAGVEGRYDLLEVDRAAPTSRSRWRSRSTCPSRGWPGRPCRRRCGQWSPRWALASRTTWSVTCERAA